MSSYCTGLNFLSRFYESMNLLLLLFYFLNLFLFLLHSEYKKSEVKNVELPLLLPLLALRFLHHSNFPDLFLRDTGAPSIKAVETRWSRSSSSVAEQQLTAGLRLSVSASVVPSQHTGFMRLRSVRGKMSIVVSFHKSQTPITYLRHF